MNYIKFLAILLSFTFILSSCGDDTDEKKFDYHAHIHSPNMDDKHVDDDLNIIIEFESHTGEPVHHINIKIYNKADNTIVYNKPSEAHVHATDGKITFEDDFILSNENGVEEHTDWVLEAKVWGDGEGIEEEIETVTFHVHP
ncbi:MAG: hypothetical protein V3V14_12410 [Saprospiraceae bacterium]